MNSRVAPFALLAALALCLPAAAMDFEWVHMTGREPIESAPVVTDLDGNGTAEILAINRAGQLLQWGLDGTSMGAGPDGIAATLPEGQWSSSPARVDTPQGSILLVSGAKNLVVALGPDLKERWRYTLPGETAFGRAFPAILTNGGDPRIGYMDQSGTFTVLKADGTLAWSKKSDEAKSGASPAAFRTPDGIEAFLVPLGSKLACLTANGDERWSAAIKTPTGKPSVVRSLPVLSPDGQIVCLADNGVVVSLNPDGTQRWVLKVTEEVDNSLAVCPLSDGKPLFVFTGVWGNLYGVSAEGTILWKHIFRSKNRGVPLIADANGDGTLDIVQATYAQHLLAFSAEGRLMDDLRLSGLANPTLTPLPGSKDFLVSTAALITYRVKPSSSHSPYAAAQQAGKVTAKWQAPAEDESQSLRVDNPTGAFVSVRLTAENTDGSRTFIDRLTTQSLLDIELPKPVLDKAERLRADVCDASGNVLVSANARCAKNRYAYPTAALPGAWATDPCGSFFATRTRPTVPETTASLTIDNLYLGETGQAAFVVAAGKTALDVRVELEQPVNDKTPFAGTLRLFKVVPVGSLNGSKSGRQTNTEMVPDALVSLSPANVISVSASGATKVWISADTRGAAPGIYTGKVTLTAMPNLKIAELPLTLNVLSLKMPKSFPLELCTWDYVPNRWHPDDTAQVLDDMQRHGVTIFPRTIVPTATLDAGGALQMDYSKLDEELDRLKGRGKILFQLTHPAITFAAPPTDEAKRAAEIDFLRAFVEHLKSRGIGYTDFAFYPVDEPGLNYLDVSVNALVDAAALFDAADPQIRVYTDPVPSLSKENFDRIAPLIDVWCPNMRQVSGLLAQDPRISGIMAANTPVWSYECVAQVKSLSPLRYNRSNPWRAWYFGLDGIGFWTHSTNTLDMWYPSDDEYALVYPGELPVPSVRWESVRDGMEDIAAVSLLEQAIAKGGEPAAIEHAKEVLRIAKNDAMELSDAAFVESRDYLAQGDRRIWHTPADIILFNRNRAAIAEATLALTK